MDATPAGGAGAELLQRGEQLAWIDHALAEAAEGHGSVTVVSAAAGLGKTSLLAAAAAAANARGFRVLSARGNELEQEMPFGVARQLFERLLHDLPRAAHDRVVAGAAELALPAVAPRADRAEGDPQGVVHGLYWLAMNLAEEQPLAIVIDDGHWCDTQSLEWLSYLALRIDEARLCGLTAVRPAEPAAGASLVAALTARESVAAIGLEPLDDVSVAVLIETQLRAAPEPAFVEACRLATGGNPFFLRELLRAAIRDHLAPGKEQAERVKRLSTGDAARSVLVRVGRLGEVAGRAAGAAAVLGADADPRRVAVLGGLSVEQALEAVDALVGGEILRDGRPLEFIHPIARAAVYDELPAARRSQWHRCAAELLADDGAPAERVAVHLLACEPTGDAEVVERLRSAAQGSISAGAPDAAARFLQRALDEPAEPALRAQLAIERGQALVGIDYAGAAASFAAAAEVSDPSTRVVALRWQGQTLALMGKTARAVAVLEEAVALAEDAEQALLLESTRDFWALGWFAEPDWQSRSALIQRRAARLEGRTAGERRALAVAAFDVACAGSDSAARSIELANRVRRAFATWLDTEPGIETPAGIGESSIIAEDPEALTRHIGVAQTTRRLGQVVTVAGAHTQLADIRLRRGELFDAEADARTSWELLQDKRERAPVYYWWSLSALIAVLTVRGLLDKADELASSTGLRTAGIEETCVIAVTPIAPVVMGELDLALGRTGEGLERLMRDGAWLEERGWPNPSLNPWRARAAPALAVAGRRDEARELVVPAVERARRFGAPWSLGMALRAAGTVEGGQRGMELLREALAVLDSGVCSVERAHALLELGAALRRSNKRIEARDQLRAALDLATRSGAAPLAERAREELAASGARLRRELLSGVESLTASERRVAELAAGGMSNPEIAQALFVTRKTIETHLGHVYMKLDIASREQLPTALAG